MTSYRFYSISKDGHIGAPAAQYELQDDAAALRKAQRLCDGLDIEIWQGARVVGYLKAEDQAADQAGEKAIVPATTFRA